MHNKDKADTDYLVILPVLNEARIIGQSVELLHKVFTAEIGENKKWKIVIADNGSTDETPVIGKNLEAKYANVVYEGIPFRGRGRALKETVKKYPSNFFIYLDADIPVSPSDIFKFFKELEDSRADIVVGKRRGERPLDRRFLSAGVRVVTGLFFGLRLSDPQCGVKAFTGKAASFALLCFEDGYFFDTEFLVLAKKNNLKVVEVEVLWIEKRYKERGSKISFIHDAWKGLAAMIRIFLRRN